MLEIFQYDFMNRALVAGLAVAIVAPLVGLFLVVRRYSYLADTLAHVSLVGVAVAVLGGFSPVLAATVAAIAAGGGIEALRRNQRVFSESVLAVFLSGSLALAVVLMSVGKRLHQDLFSYLFGSITTVTPTEVWTIAIVAGVVALTVLIVFKELFLLTLHEELAQAEGLRVRVYSVLLMVLSAVTIAVAMRVVGSLLVGALMVIPVLTAAQIARSFWATAIWSVFLSVLATFLGLIGSFYFDIPSGASIVVAALLILVATFVCMPQRR